MNQMTHWFQKSTDGLLFGSHLTKLTTIYWDTLYSGSSYFLSVFLIIFQNNLLYSGTSFTLGLLGDIMHNNWV